MTIDEQIIGMTTLVRSVCEERGLESQGTGFFYEEQGWSHASSVLGEYLVTNRHVVFPREHPEDCPDEELTPDYVEFNLRDRVTEADGTVRIDWHPVVLRRDDLLQRVHLHPNPAVDVVAIEIQDYLDEAYRDKTFSEVVGHHRLSNYYMPMCKPLSIQATTDIIVCSYPHGFCDRVNKFPIIKSGIIASSWGADFGGDPCFLVDCQLFPGSSGGLVLSKPSGGDLVLLGIFSHTYAMPVEDEDGETTYKDLGLGVVWYSDLLSDIVEHGSYYL